MKERQKLTDSISSPSQGNFKKKLVVFKEELAALPERKDLDELNESLSAKVASQGQALHAEAAKIADQVTKLAEDTLPNDYATKEDVNVSKELAVREARSMQVKTGENATNSPTPLGI